MIELLGTVIAEPSWNDVPLGLNTASSCKKKAILMVDDNLVKIRFKRVRGNKEHTGHLLLVINC